MNLYLVSRTDWFPSGGRYHHIIVAANSNEQAVLMHPNEELTWAHNSWVRKDGKKSKPEDSWTDPKNVKALHIGIALNDVTEPTVVERIFVDYN
jgi:hypothetical protein